jgi:hypothetical protein
LSDGVLFVAALSVWCVDRTEGAGESDVETVGAKQVECCEVSW